MIRITRDGHRVSAFPIRQPLSVASLIAQRIGLLLFVAGCVVTAVGMVVP